MVADGLACWRESEMPQDQMVHVQPRPVGFTNAVSLVSRGRLIAEYLAAAPASAVEDAVQTLAGPNLLRMAHTHDGATAACCVLAWGTAKDRKQAVKAMYGAGPQGVGSECGPATCAINVANEHTGALRLLFCKGPCRTAGGCQRLLSPSCQCGTYARVSRWWSSVVSGHVTTMAHDQWAHLVLLTALSRVDDTALLRKSIVSDIQVSRDSCCRSAALTHWLAVAHVPHPQQLDEDKISTGGLIPVTRVDHPVHTDGAPESCCATFPSASHSLRPTPLHLPPAAACSSGCPPAVSAQHLHNPAAAPGDALSEATAVQHPRGVVGGCTCVIVIRNLDMCCVPHQANLAELLDSASARRVLLGLVSPAACRRTMPDVAVATFDPPPRYMYAPGGPAIAPLPMARRSAAWYCTIWAPVTNVTAAWYCRCVTLIC